jgi:hypothetical protein
VKTSWQTEADQIVCRWTESEERIQYNPPWLQEAARSTDRSARQEVPDFSTHSPLGLGEWFVPWHARWGVPGKSMI